MRGAAGVQIWHEADQDRSRWDRAEIEAGRAALARSEALPGRGPYALQAAIASLHAAERNDWRRMDHRAEARDAYQRALALVRSDSERRLLERRLAELEARTS
jgi:predicted RNA polymerase sigma factor